MNLEEYKKLQEEIEHYRNSIDGINAEKVALDQMLVENLKSLLAVRKENILLNEKVNKLNQECDSERSEKELLHSKLLEIKDEIVQKELSDHLNIPECKL